MNSGPGWQNALVPWGWPGQLPVQDAGNLSVGKRGVEKAEAASLGKGWSGGWDCGRGEGTGCGERT